MVKHAHSIDIFLHQGEVYFGNQDIRIRTVLGSCVAITMWHPVLLLGGMCHYMLPTRRAGKQVLHCRIGNSPIAFPSRRKRAQKSLDGKYADEALELMLSEIRRNGTRPDEYQIKLFGGGNMFPQTPNQDKRHVGSRNVEAGIELLIRHGLKAQVKSLGGHGHRNLIFDIRNGHVWVKHQVPADSPGDDCATEVTCLHP